MQQKRKRRRRLYLGMAFVCVLLLVGGSYLVYAAMTAKDSKVNDFQIGQVETKLVVSNESITEIPKNTSIPKSVRIENKGTIKQFVRVMVLPEVRTSIVGDPNNEQLLPLVIGTDLLLEEMTTNDWKAGGDGYYYYIKGPLETSGPDKVTSDLFKKVKLSNQLSDQYHKASLTITLKVEAINCAKDAYRDAWWQGTVPNAGSPLKAIDDVLKDKAGD